MIRSPFEQGDFDFVWSAQGDPAVATNLLINAPVNARSELVALSFKFSADANAADRWMRISSSSGLIVILLGNSEYPITANKDRWIIVGPTGHSSVADGGDSQTIGTVPFPVLLEGDIIRTNVVNIQAGDQISDVYYVFKTWIYEQ